MLSDFTDSPAVKLAWKEFAAKTRLPFKAREVEIKAPSCGRFSSSVGPAFDYLARFRLARAMHESNSQASLFDNGWAAQDAVDKMEHHQAFGQYHRRWSLLLGRARELFEDYAHGREQSLDRVARCCQYLGAVELLFRIDGFNPNFKDRPEVQEELLALSKAFDPKSLFSPRKTVILNPTFAASPLVDGADADLIVDNAVIDFKSVSDVSYSSALMRKLVGYAILHQNGGAIWHEGSFYQEPITEVGVYYSRYGILAKWHIEDLLPDGGYGRFEDAFMEEVSRVRRENGLDPEPEPEAPTGAFAP